MRFGKISANEFFNTVDFNGDGEIAFDEFVEFWEIVKGSGHTEDEIREEVSTLAHMCAYNCSELMRFLFLSYSNVILVNQN